MCVCVRLCICERTGQRHCHWRRNMYETTAKIAPTISPRFSFLRFYDDGDDGGGEGSGRIFLCPTKREPLPDVYDWRLAAIWFYPNRRSKSRTITFQSRILSLMLFSLIRFAAFSFFHFVLHFLHRNVSSILSTSRCSVHKHKHIHTEIQ